MRAGSGFRSGFAIVWWPYGGKGIRQLAYGTATVAIPVWLVRHGISPLDVGALVALGLLSGAAQSWSAAWLASWWSPRTVALASAAAMIVGAALLLTQKVWLLPAAALLGGMSIGAQEVGPFTALEQVAIERSTRGAHAFAWYNAIGTMAFAAGSIIGSRVAIDDATAIYLASASLLFVLYRYSVPAVAFTKKPQRSSTPGSLGIAERLAALFAIDAFAGGFVAPGFIVYWLTLRYSPNPHFLGEIFAASSILSALSLFAAAWLASHLGLLRTMVFTHLPSNLFLALIPLAPTFEAAAALLLARSALSQMDVPTRQALVLSSVPAEQRVHAAGVTNAVRPAAAAASPTLAGLAMQMAANGSPFFIAGILKSAYDVSLLFFYPRIVRAPAVQREAHD